MKWPLFSKSILYTEARMQCIRIKINTDWKESLHAHAFYTITAFTSLLHLVSFHFILFLHTFLFICLFFNVYGFSNSCLGFIQWILFFILISLELLFFFQFFFIFHLKRVVLLFVCVALCSFLCLLFVFHHSDCNHRLVTNQIRMIRTIIRRVNCVKCAHTVTRHIKHGAYAGNKANYSWFRFTKVGFIIRTLCLYTFRLCILNMHIISTSMRIRTMTAGAVRAAIGNVHCPSIAIVLKMCQFRLQRPVRSIG